MSLARLVLTYAITLGFIATVEANTLGHWRFEEGLAGSTATGAGSILDSSGNLLHGTPFGDPAYSSNVAGSAPGALSIDLDSDVIRIPTSPALDSSDPFVVEFWMLGNDTDTAQDLLVDKSHGFTDSTGWFFQSLPGANKGIVQFGIGLGGGSSTNFIGISSQNDLMDGTWHYLKGVYDGGQIEFFVDGISQGTAPGVYFGNTRPIQIGNTWQSSRLFNGHIDELRISSIPEPGALSLLVLGALGIVTNRRRS